MSREKWEGELVTINEQIADVTDKLRIANNYRDTTYGETYYARQDNARKFKAWIKKLETKRRYRERKLRELDGPPVHYDCFGQELAVGCEVVWCQSNAYARISRYFISKVNDKQLTVSWDRQTTGYSHVDPGALIVVDKLVEGYSPQD